VLRLKLFLFGTFSAGFFFLCYYLYAQSIPDSLVYKLNNTKDDSVRIRTLLDMGEASEATSINSSLNYYRQAFSAAQKMGNKHLMLSALNDIGIAYIESNKFDSAIVFLEKAVQVAGEMGDSVRMAKIMSNIGNVYINQNNRVKALEYYLKSVNGWENATDKTGLAGLYSNIRQLFTDQMEYPKAIEYGNKGFELARQIGDDHSAVNALVNLSGTYNKLRQFEKEFELLNQALPLAEKSGNIEQIATIYHDLGGYYFEKKDYQASLENYQRSYGYTKQLDNKYHLCNNYTVLAVVYFKIGRDAEARKYILLAENLANQVGARADLKQIYQTRAEIEQKSGNYKMAADYFSKRITLSDSLFESETSEKIADIEARYQNEKKLLEIKQLENDKKIQAYSIRQKSILNYILIGSLAALLTVGFLVYRNLRNRHQLAKQQDELQQQRIRELEKDKQLVAVDSLLKGQEGERSRLAKDLHDGLGGLLSGIKFSLSNMKSNLVVTPDNMAVFERSLDMIDTSIRELRRVAHNMMPEMLTKFGLDEALREYCNTINSTKMLSVKYQSLGMEKRLEDSSEIIIYRIVQELLNNTMKHADATEAFVQIIREGNRLNVVVEDNGKGFDASGTNNNKGAGLVNVRSRVEYLKGQLDIHSEPGKGTLVNIELNIQS
jgi:two-component system NarL family sensor kinase